MPNVAFSHLMLLADRGDVGETLFGGARGPDYEERDGDEADQVREDAEGAVAEAGAED